MVEKIQSDESDGKYPHTISIELAKVGRARIIDGKIAAPDSCKKANE